MVKNFRIFPKYSYIYIYNYTLLFLCVIDVSFGNKRLNVTSETFAVHQCEDNAVFRRSFSLLGTTSSFRIQGRYKTETMRWCYVILFSTFFSLSFLFPFIDIYSRRRVRAAVSNRDSPTERLQSVPTVQNIMIAHNHEGCNALVYRVGQGNLEEKLLLELRCSHCSRDKHSKNGCVQTVSEILVRCSETVCNSRACCTDSEKKGVS